MKSETVITIVEEEHPFIVTLFNYLQLMRIGKVEVGRVMNLSGTLV